MQVKTLLVFAIVTAVGFVAANSVTQQASAWGSCSPPAGGETLTTPGHATPCVSSHVPIPGYDITHLLPP